MWSILRWYISCFNVMNFTVWRHFFYLNEPIWGDWRSHMCVWVWNLPSFQTFSLIFKFFPPQYYGEYASEKKKKKTATKICLTKSYLDECYQTIQCAIELMRSNAFSNKTFEQKHRGDAQTQYNTVLSYILYPLQRTTWILEQCRTVSLIEAKQKRYISFNAIEFGHCCALFYFFCGDVAVCSRWMVFEFIWIARDYLWYFQTNSTYIKGSQYLLLMG